MRKCIKTRFQPLLTLKNIFFKAMFLVVWKHAKMHQNTLSTTPDVKNDFIFRVVWKHAQMPQNTFLTTPDTKKYLFQGHVSGGLEACENASKHVFNHS
jgi:hypothetical protein